MILHRILYRKKPWLAAALTLMSLTSPLCMAAPLATVGLSGGIEAFRLKEFDGSGSRLLLETGNRYVTTAFLDDGGKYDLAVSIHYHLEASAYWGRVDYDGKSQSVDPSQSNIPLISKTDYQGGRAEALLGYRIKPLGGPRNLDLIGGLGVDGWNRRIHNATASNGTLVSGIEETYRVYYGKIALGLNNLYSSSWRNQLQFGVKLPFNISEDIGLSNVGYDSNLTLSPGNTYSGFIKLQLEPQSKDNKPGNLVINVYYDGFRFNPSKAKTVTHNGSPVQVWQPETHIDILGLQIGYRF
jgi:hypothetical protein